MARTQRVFGPLFYTTAVLAAFVILYACWLKLEERVVYATAPPPPPLNIEAELVHWASAFKDSDASVRVAATSRLGNLVRILGPGDFGAGPRGEVVGALRTALRDSEPAVRQGAAEALAGFAGPARAARAELLAALKDDDVDVRFAAASTLIPAGGDLVAPALEAMAAMAAGGDLPARADRAKILNVMASAGDAGANAAASILQQLLTSPNSATRRLAVAAVGEVDPTVADRARATVESLLKDKDANVRCAAAVALLQWGRPVSAAPSTMGMAGMAMIPGGMRPRPGPQVPPVPGTRYPLAVETLVKGVADASLPFPTREAAIGALIVSSPESLYKCGLELARQLGHEDRQVRLNAARLLHMIEDQALAGPIDDAGGGDDHR